jgi:hypothetical protein
MSVTRTGFAPGAFQSTTSLPPPVIKLDPRMAARIQRILPRSDRLAVIHNGEVSQFAGPYDLEASVLMARDIRERAARRAAWDATPRLHRLQFEIAGAVDLWASALILIFGVVIARALGL